MGRSLETSAQRGVTLNVGPPLPPTPNLIDVPLESAISDLRVGLLRHVVVRDALLALADLRLADDQLRYGRCVLMTAESLKVFTFDEIDFFASIIRQRLENGLWGVMAPVGGNPRYGRRGERARGPNPATVSLAVEALAHRLGSARRGEPASTLVADDLGYSWAYIRKLVERLPALANYAPG
ncbi:hypothetical protein OJ997_27660 [Solirubrobacter phytolaccae]|uniref:Uncharacterized protein n=1 Tax=Solirubrobacter phytolaccae TaxID=1404360 RepID=A0A9X3NFM0_9ACTN|nr:hypothetical protein [Solirubrobacter phytolaccae]MDA0184117.1 hypothetical protein [Solirubrobacter phytolaccae]